MQSDFPPFHLILFIFFTISLVPDSFGILPSSQMFQMKRNGNGNGGTWQKTWNSALPRNQPTRRFLEILSRFFVIFHNLNFKSFKKVLKCYSIWFNLVLKCSSHFPQQSSFFKILIHSNLLSLIQVS